MNGISLPISKSICPMYSFGRSNKRSFGRISEKMDLIPCGLSNLHNPIRFSNPVLSIKPLLKHHHHHHHRVYSSSSKDETSSTSEVSSIAIPYVVFALLGTIGLVLREGGIQGALTWIVCYHIFLGGAVAVFVARGFLRDIMFGFAVLWNKPFEVGDTIEVGHLKGYVVEMGHQTTTLIFNNKRMEVPTRWFYGQVIMKKSRATTIVPYSLLLSGEVLNKPRPPWHCMAFKVYLEKDTLKVLKDLLKELTKMIKSNPNAYVGQDMRSNVALDFSGPTDFELSFVCYIKQMSEEKLYLAKQDVVLQSLQIIKKHGLKVAGHKQLFKETL